MTSFAEHRLELAGIFCPALAYLAKPKGLRSITDYQAVIGLPLELANAGFVVKMRKDDTGYTISVSHLAVVGVPGYRVEISADTLGNTLFELNRSMLEKIGELEAKAAQMPLELGQAA